MLVFKWTFPWPCRVSPKARCDALTHSSVTEMPRLSRASYHRSRSLAKHSLKKDTPAALLGFRKPISQLLWNTRKGGLACTMLLHATCYFFLSLVMGPLWSTRVILQIILRLSQRRSHSSLTGTTVKLQLYQ